MTELERLEGFEREYIALTQKYNLSLLCCCCCQLIGEHENDAFFRISIGRTDINDKRFARRAEGWVER